MEPVALRLMKGVLLEVLSGQALQPPPWATERGVQLSLTPHCTALSFGTSEEMQNSAWSQGSRENQRSCLEKAAFPV